MKILSGSLLLSALILALGSQSPLAHGCGVAMQKGESVIIASESALIVWDEKTKTQHFIRRASFSTRAPYFGFLVPTPTRPKLGETPDEVFQRLEDWTKPEERTETVHDVPISIGCGARDPGEKSVSVAVLEQQHVAGFDYTILKATDGKSLREWLEKHGYDARPQLTDWVEPYIKKGWIITAFQIAKTNKEEDRLSTKAVRMSFATDRPFFPYREPGKADRNENDYKGRLLRVFLVSGQRMEGTLGAQKASWPGKAVWANPLQDEQSESLANLLDQGQVPVSKGTWLTVFDDKSSPRNFGNRRGEDLFFSPSDDQSSLQRLPIIYYRRVYWLGGLICLSMIAAPMMLLFVVLRLGRRNHR